MSNLVTYSSGEEEDPQEHKVVSKTIPDVNYDDVQMEMSDDDDDDDDGEEDASPSSRSSSEEAEKTAAEKNLFASEEDYLAYKKQFSKPNGSLNGNKPSPTDSGAEKEPQQVKNSSARGSENSKHSKQQSFDKADQSSNSKGSRKDRSRSRSPVRSGKKRDDRKRSSHHSHGHRHRRERSHSRSRSRDRERSSSSRREHRQRSRSSSRERRRRDSRDNDNGRDRQELRHRKLFSMGLTESDRPKASQPHHLGGSNQERAIKAQLDHVKAVTGVELPKYYNPTAINPLKYAEQIKKRQLLWGPKKSDDGAAEPAPEAQKPVAAEQKPSTAAQSQGGCSYNKWETTNFGNSKANEKFRRLMGIKGSSDTEKVAEAPKVDSRQIFGQLEQEYERARAITHTQRGLGLGFSSLGGAAPTPSQPAPTAGIHFVKK